MVRTNDEIKVRSIKVIAKDEVPQETSFLYVT